ncbi:MAG: deoxyribose-phosphate aldolase [Eubacteriales bacterium]|nr:deoxyribose-phosphate aldolase [Eubacteriales bacterium]
MEIEKILSACDHTLLKQDATWEQIMEICDDAAKYHTASVCIPPCYVKQAKAYAGSSVRICTVIGFPNGNMTTAAKVFETRDAIENGADEIDMVINIGMLKAGDEEYVLSEIKAVKAACKDHILKVIIETCLLTEAEKKTMCRIVTESGADFIKTSTGFGGGGATFDDIRLFAEHVGPAVRIKAAGGISSLEDAEKFMELGAERLGTSRVVKIAKSMLSIKE